MANVSSGYGSLSCGHEIDYSPEEKIRRNFNYLRDTLDTSYLCDHLYQKKRLNDENIQSIQAERIECRKADRFLQILLVKGPPKDLYNDFLISLKKCGQEYIVTELESTIRDSPEDVPEEAAQCAIDYLLIESHEVVLQGIDPQQLARNCLQHGVIRIDDYICVFNEERSSLAREKLYYALIQMPQLALKISDFLLAIKEEQFSSLRNKIRHFKERKERQHLTRVTVEIAEGRHNHLKRGRQPSYYRMCIHLHNNEVAKRIKNAIQNKHPEMMYLLTKHFHARKVTATTGSVLIAFKTAGNLECKAMEPRESTHDHLSEFLNGALSLCNTDYEIPSIRITVQALDIKAYRNDIRNSSSATDPEKIIIRRGKMMERCLDVKSYVGCMWHYIESPKDLIDTVKENGTEANFLSHVQLEEEMVYNRISWLGSGRELSRGFKAQEKAVIHIKNAEELIANLDPTIFTQELLDGLITECSNSPSTAMMRLLKFTTDSDGKTGHKGLANIYDELCNLLHFQLVDNIRESGREDGNSDSKAFSALQILERRKKMVIATIKFKRYLHFAKAYFEGICDFVKLVQRKHKILHFLSQIEATEDGPLYNRIVWFGSYQRLLYGFLANYDLLVNFKKVDLLLTNLDLQKVEKQKTEECKIMARRNKRFAMILLLQNILEAGPESIEHLYDTLCNMVEFEIIDKIRQSATGIDIEDLPVNNQGKTADMVLFEGTFTVRRTVHQTLR